MSRRTPATKCLATPKPTRKASTIKPIASRGLTSFVQQSDAFVSMEGSMELTFSSTRGVQFPHARGSSNDSREVRSLAMQR